jgi:CheY-like chemotaxis protein
MDGVTLVTIIRSYLRWQTLPIVVFSAHADDRARQRLGESGVSEVLVKGRDGPAEVAEAVARQLAARGSDAGRS